MKQALSIRRLAAMPSNPNASRTTIITASLLNAFISAVPGYDSLLNERQEIDHIFETVHISKSYGGTIGRMYLINIRHVRIPDSV